MLNKSESLLKRFHWERWFLDFCLTFDLQLENEEFVLLNDVKEIQNVSNEHV